MAKQKQPLAYGKNIVTSVGKQHGAGQRGSVGYKDGGFARSDKSVLKKQEQEPPRKI